MLLTLTARADPPPGEGEAPGLTDATDLGFLLHKHPDRAQSSDLPVGRAHVVYPEASPARTTAALLLEVPPAAPAPREARGRAGSPFALAQYVDARPYTAGSLFAVALGKVLATARSGRCDARPHLPGLRLDLELHLPAAPARGGADLVRRLFAPLGWDVDARPLPLDPSRPVWGAAELVDLRLRGRVRLADALGHLYVLLPVLDDAKHYWVGAEEVDKLLRAAGGWLPEHPERELVTARYLKHQRSLVTDAAARLQEVDGVPSEDAAAPGDAPAPDDGAPPDDGPAAAPVGSGSLAALRTAAVLAELRACGAAGVVDLGCGEGRLLAALLEEPRFARVLGVDVSPRELARADRRLALDRRGDSQRARVHLVQGSVLYRDARLAGFDAAVLQEVVEHVDPARLPALERTVFGAARPRTVVVTTPNAEHNALYPDLRPGEHRHHDHRFEWTRAEFAAWARAVADAHGYRVRFVPVGEEHPDAGPPTQMAVLTLEVPA